MKILYLKGFSAKPSWFQICRSPVSPSSSTANLQRRLQRLQRARSVKSTVTTENNAVNVLNKTTIITKNGGLKQKLPPIGNEARKKVSSEGRKLDRHSDYEYSPIRLMDHRLMI